ncbi:MAG TPA: alpha-ribazole phosphatase [Nitrospirae bacterium]|nr:phosphoserine phosphatase 1 [bacterium BMS3Bbin09]HDH34824.1 alpha-ribazole phosphatase [Nitrospirota bacterium]HDO67054.1 alpha-ribazole phosphatase [Nitrospirota bacterium]HEW81228.1 alpha-ribazole phosphatase [Nitrospirota bacterium]
MGTKIYLIRHGEVEDSDPRRYNGHIDVSLSANGVEQIRKLSSFLSAIVQKRNSAIGAVYCSGLSRASKSAEIIAEPFGLKPIVIDELKERNFGEWEGMSFDEISDKWPDAFSAWARDPLRFSPMEGESTLDLRERVMPAFNKIMEDHEGEDIAVVSHGGVTRVILCEMLGIPLENIFRIEQDFGALNVIEMWDYPVVKQINFVV